MGTDSILALVALVEGAGTLGVDTAALWARSGVPEILLRDPDARVDCEILSELVEAAIEASGHEDIHLRVLDPEGRDSVQLIHFVIAGSQNLGDALVRMQRFLPIWTEALHLTIEPGEHQHRLGVIPRATRRLGLAWRQAAALWFIVSYMNRALVVPFRPARVQLEIEQPNDTRLLESVFGPTIEYGRPVTEIAIRAADLDIACRDARLTYVPMIDALLDAADGPSARSHDDLHDVRRALVTLLPAGAPTLPELAERLGITGPELQKRLAKAEVDYAAVLRSVREEVSKSLVRRGTTPLAETAMMAGYRNLGSFHRAFKRWTGRTAGHVRDAAVSDAPHSATATASPIEITSSAGLVSVMIAGAASFGADEAPLWALAGLDPTGPADPSQRVPSARFYDIVEAAVVATAHEDICLRIRLGLEITAFGVFGYALATSVDVHDMFRRLARFLAFWDELELEVDTDERGACIRVHSHVAPRRGQELHVAAILGNCLIQGRRLARREFEVTEVKLPGVPVDDLEIYERVFRGPIEFGVPVGEMRISREELAHPISGAHPELAEIVARYVHDQLETHPRESAVVRDARRTIASLLPAGEARIEVVARHLATSTRTLQRKLADANVRFDMLVDDARRSISLSHVRTGRLTMGEIAFATGFANPSSFHRAFKRWTGSSPSEWRAREESVRENED